METRLIDYQGPGLAWDVGAYRGAWSLDMVTRGFQVQAFEPVEPCIACGDGIVWNRFGLMDKDCELEVSLAGDRSSTFTATDLPKVKAPFRDVSTVLGDTVVDVMKLNVEGAEFPILRRLIDTGQISQVRSMLIQFHGFMPNAYDLYMAIAKDLKSTHTMRWRDPWAWERWDLRG